jgi:hypothetical protein
MSRSVGAAAVVLESLRLLYDVGADVDLDPGELIAAFEWLCQLDLAPG